MEYYEIGVQDRSFYIKTVLYHIFNVQYGNVDAFWINMTLLQIKM